MKKTFLSIAFTLLSWAIYSQQVLTYNFLGNFNEQNNAGPILIPIGTGQFGADSLPDYNELRSVYHFDKNCGFYFDDSLTNFLSSGSYTIELYFKMKELNSWKRVVDFKSRTSDGGCYVFNGQLNFYPIQTSSGAPFAEEEYAHYVITRDGNTKQIMMYGDGNKFITFTDAGDAGVYGSNKQLNFFHDDLIVPNEASAGSVALLRIHTLALDSNTVKDNYDNLGPTLAIRGVNYNIDIKVFPIPANDLLQLQIPNGTADKYRYAVYDINGRLINHGDMNAKTISVTALSQGVYHLKVWNTEHKEMGITTFSKL